MWQAAVCLWEPHSHLSTAYVLCNVNSNLIVSIKNVIGAIYFCDDEKVLLLQIYNNNNNNNNNIVFTRGIPSANRNTKYRIEIKQNPTNERWSSRYSCFNFWV